MKKLNFKKNNKGFTLVMSLVLLLVMSLMGGALVVIASSDHSDNNSSDRYQQTFYVAETALIEAQKSLIDKMMGPFNTATGSRDEGYVPLNQTQEQSRLLTTTKCFRSFKNVSRSDDFQVVEHKMDQSFHDLIAPIFSGDSAAYLKSLHSGTDEEKDEEVIKEKNFVMQFVYEYFSVYAGSSSAFKSVGSSIKKTSGTTQRNGSAYRIYGCGILGTSKNPIILVPLETIVILAH